MSSFARVFDMKEMSVAPYVRATGGHVWTHQEAFIQELKTTSVDQSPIYSFSGELGVLFRIADPVNIRLGAELFKPDPVSNANGTSPGGASWLTMNSNILVFNPQVALEFVVKGTKTNRLLFLAAVGYGTVNLKNEFSVTSAGQTALGHASYTETATATVVNYSAGAGWEFLFVDHVMMMLELGYRHFPVTGLTHSQIQSTFAQSSGAAEGTPLLNSDGTERKFDLSGPFVGVSFRFFLQ